MWGPCRSVPRRPCPGSYCADVISVYVTLNRPRCLLRPRSSFYASTDRTCPLPPSAASRWRRSARATRWARRSSRSACPSCQIAISRIVLGRRISLWRMVRSKLRLRCPVRRTGGTSHIAFAVGFPRCGRGVPRSRCWSCGLPACVVVGQSVETGERHHAQLVAVHHAGQHLGLQQCRR